MNDINIQIQADEEQNGTTVTYPYAGLFRRIMAYFIDYFIVAIPINILSDVVFAIRKIPINSILAAVNDMLQNPQNYAVEEMLPMLMPVYITQMFITGTITWLYYALMESSKLQGTLGKKLLGMTVLTDTGKRLTFLRATARYFSKILSSMTFGIGYLLIAFTRKKQALHDLVACTVIVKRPVVKIIIDDNDF